MEGQSCNRHLDYCDAGIWTIVTLESLKGKDQNLQLSRKFQEKRDCNSDKFHSKSSSLPTENKMVPSDLTIWGCFLPTPAFAGPHCHSKLEKIMNRECSWNAGRWREYIGHLACLLALLKIIFSGRAQFLSGSKFPSRGPRQSLPLQRARLKQTSRIAGHFWGLFS